MEAKLITFTSEMDGPCVRVMATYESSGEQVTQEVGRFDPSEIFGITDGGLRLCTHPDSALSFPTPFPCGWEFPFGDQKMNEGARFVVNAEGMRSWLQGVMVLARFAMDVHYRQLAERLAAKGKDDLARTTREMAGWVCDLTSDEAEERMRDIANIAASVAPEGSLFMPGMFSQPVSVISSDEYRAILDARLSKTPPSASSAVNASPE